MDRKIRIALMHENKEKTARGGGGGLPGRISEVEGNLDKCDLLKDRWTKRFMGGLTSSIKPLSHQAREGPKCTSAVVE